jgi:hypothetical protein
MTNINVVAVLGKARRRLSAGRQNLDDAWQELAVAWQDVADVVAQLNTDLEREQTRNDELAAKLREVMETQTAHDARLNALSQQRTSERLTSGTYIVHHEIAERYRNLRDQALVRLAYTIPNLTPKGEATVLHWLGMALFHPSFNRIGPEGAYRQLRAEGQVTIPPRDFEQVWREASKIREEATASGHQHKWDFGCQPGQPVDESCQEVYQGCHPGDLVVFMVAPGYVVDDKTVYVKQQVFTAPPTQPSPSSANKGSYWEKPSDPRAEDSKRGQPKQGGPPQEHQPGPSTPQSAGGAGQGIQEQQPADGPLGDADAGGPKKQPGQLGERDDRGPADPLHRRHDDDDHPHDSVTDS